MKKFTVIIAVILGIIVLEFVMRKSYTITRYTNEIGIWETIVTRNNDYKIYGFLRGSSRFLSRLLPSTTKSVTSPGYDANAVNEIIEIIKIRKCDPSSNFYIVDIIDQQYPELGPSDVLWRVVIHRNNGSYYHPIADVVVFGDRSVKYNRKP